MKTRNALDFTAAIQTRPTVLIPLPFYLPGYKSGGPIRSISGIVGNLGKEFDFKIITSDRDFGDNAPYEGIESNQWVSVGNAKVLYVRNGDPLAVLRWIRTTPHHILYLNSFFSRAFSMVPMWAHAAGILRNSSVILAPHGEFSSGALMIKPWRKRVYIALARNLSAYRRLLWHASSEYEFNDIQRIFGRVVALQSAACFAAEKRITRNPLAITTAQDLSAQSAPAADISLRRAPKGRGELRAVFLSRVARMKNLAGALRLLGGLRGRVTFDIYGPLEDPVYWQECRDLISRLPPNIQVRYRRVVPYTEVQNVLSGYDLFVLPTLGEAFGHAISDALVAGCPVLISDRTPWRDLERLNAGWDLPLDQSAMLQEALQRCIDMSPEDHAALCAGAKAFGLKRSLDPESLAQNRGLFIQALEHAHSNIAVNRPADNLI
jgi:glycosyltransferase involved in cell wall biosynthesis